MSNEISTVCISCKFFSDLTLSLIFAFFLLRPEHIVVFGCLSSESNTGSSVTALTRKYVCRCICRHMHTHPLSHSLSQCLNFAWNSIGSSPIILGIIAGRERNWSSSTGSFYFVPASICIRSICVTVIGCKREVTLAHFVSFVVRLTEKQICSIRLGEDC